MTIKTVVARIDFASDEPLSERCLPLEYFAPRFEPMQLLRRLFGKELLWIFHALCIELFVFGDRLDTGGLSEAFRWSEFSFFEQARLDVGARLGGGADCVLRSCVSFFARRLFCRLFRRHI